MEVSRRRARPRLMLLLLIRHLLNRGRARELASRWPSSLRADQGSELELEWAQSAGDGQVGPLIGLGSECEIRFLFLVHGYSFSEDLARFSLLAKDAAITTRGRCIGDARRKH